MGLAENHLAVAPPKDQHKVTLKLPIEIQAPCLIVQKKRINKEIFQVQPKSQKQLREKKIRNNDVKGKQRSQPIVINSDSPEQKTPKKK